MSESKSFQMIKQKSQFSTIVGGAENLEDLFKRDERLRDYPSTLNFYMLPPQENITLLEFEKIALDRLMVLVAIDSARLRTKAEADMQKLIDPIASTRLDLKRNTTASSVGAHELYNQRKKDHFSHYILRLAYCKTPDLQQWFIRQECMLFKLRFNNASPQERDLLIQQAKLNLSPVSFETMLQEVSRNLPANNQNSVVKSISAIYGENQFAFYKVPFETVGELVAKRQVIVNKGFAYVPESERVVLVVNRFKAHLEREMATTAKALPSMDEDDRIMPILYSLAKQSLSREYQFNSGSDADVRAENVSMLSAHFPPCMQSLYNSLLTNSHLKHNGRIQFGLFLKGIGLTLDEALIFWRRSFAKLSDDDYNKKGYVYNIRYNYGQEGKRTNYTPHSCMKIIQSLPGPNDVHGCPFRTYAAENLSDMLQRLSVDPTSSQMVLQKAKEGHYQLACTKLFELTRGKTIDANAKKENPIFGLDADGNFMLMEPIDHPNKWFDLSYSGKSRRGPTAKRETMMDIDQ